MEESIFSPIALYAQKARLRLEGEAELLSAGMEGLIQVAFRFSPDWDGLHKTAVFSNGAATVNVPEEQWDENLCVVPAEVLRSAGKTVMAGVYGTNGLHLVLPTVWCVLGRVEPAASPGELTASPVPALAGLDRRVLALENAAELTVNVLSVTPIDDTRSALTLDADLAAIEAAAAARPVSLRMFGGVYPLTRLVSGNRAEFTGPVYQAEGTSWYERITVTQAGAEVAAVQIGGGYALPAGGIPKTDLAQAVQTSLGRADAALAANQGAANSGKVLAVGSDGAVAPRAMSQLLTAWAPAAGGYGGT
jgi:hypothetical protein